MIDITALGGTTVLTLLTVIVAGYLAIARRAHTALFMIFAVSGGALANSLLKLLYSRSRPDVVPHLVEVSSKSFPSGHAMNSAVVFLTLGALIARTQPDRRIRTYVMSVATLLTLTVGFSRVYLGVHWPSDVIAGWTVGAFWSAACSIVAICLQKRRRIEPPSAP